MFLALSVALSLLMATATIVQTKYKKPEFVVPKNINFNALTKDIQKQLTCLAENIYFEAAHEPLEGKKAVAFVTVNRLQSGNYADTICDVVYQKVGRVCQFSWYCEQRHRANRLTIKNTSLYNDILDLAVYFYFNFDNLTDVTGGATFYHANYVNPEWRFKRVKTIGKHIFYVHRGDKIDRQRPII